MTKSSQEIALPAWNLLLSQRKEFLDKQLVQSLITHNHQGRFQMKEDVLASAGAQDMGSSGNDLSDLEDIEFYWHWKWRWMLSSNQGQILPFHQ